MPFKPIHITADPQDWADFDVYAREIKQTSRQEVLRALIAQGAARARRRDSEPRDEVDHE
jgi:hypothetical protein